MEPIGVVPFSVCNIARVLSGARIAVAVKWAISPKASVSQGPIQTETVDHDSVVVGYDSHADNEAAIRTVAKSGFDLKKLSIVGKDYSRSGSNRRVLQRRPAAPNRIHRRSLRADTNEVGCFRRPWLRRVF